MQILPADSELPGQLIGILKFPIVFTDIIGSLFCHHLAVASAQHPFTPPGHPAEKLHQLKPYDAPITGFDLFEFP